VSLPTPEQVAEELSAWRGSAAVQKIIADTIRARDEAHAYQLRELVDALDVLSREDWVDLSLTNQDRWLKKSRELVRVGHLSARAESRQTERVQCPECKGLPYAAYVSAGSIEHSFHDKCPRCAGVGTISKSSSSTTIKQGEN